MLKILYFAWLRGKTGLAGEDLALDRPMTVLELIERLRPLSPGHAQAFAQLDLIRVAVNQDYVGLDHTVAAGDEVAFFPPVTGG